MSRRKHPPAKKKPEAGIFVSEDTTRRKVRLPQINEDQAEIYERLLGRGQSFLVFVILLVCVLKM